jgi:hypothetical protein
MSSKDKHSPLHLPSTLLIILALCAFGLIIHFVAESLEPAMPMVVLEITGQGGHSHPVCEEPEDDFVFPPSEAAYSRSYFIPIIAGTIAELSSRSISPLLPPPNL